MQCDRKLDRSNEKGLLFSSIHMLMPADPFLDSSLVIQCGIDQINFLVLLCSAIVKHNDFGQSKISYNQNYVRIRTGLKIACDCKLEGQCYPASPLWLRSTQ